ncbi:MAG: cytochrome C oxidase subunit IV family protein [Pirellulales bacterium]
MNYARTTSIGTYTLVLAALVVLTLLSVGLSFGNFTAAWHLTIGLSIAACKAALVGLFFMHLLESPRITWLVVIVALFWFGVVLLALTFSDYLTRATFPFIPGH